MRVKICGITSSADAELAVAAGADFIGIILSPSTRQVTLSAAARIAAELAGRVPAVLVFRDAPLEDVVAAVRVTGAPWVQLHGRETVDYLGAYRRACAGVKVIKAWEVVDESAATEILEYVRVARVSAGAPDVVLLDAPKGGAHPGAACLGAVSRGIAASADRGADTPPETWCAGGLTAQNVRAAIAQGTYGGVDVAGGVEITPGVKDGRRLEAFVGAVRAMDNCH
jgi:phosphoribosylanthranilate isomerase